MEVRRVDKEVRVDRAGPSFQVGQAVGHGQETAIEALRPEGHLR